MRSRIKPSSAQKVTRESHRSDKQLCAWGQRATRHMLEAESASVRVAARWMGVAPSTVSRALAGKVMLDPRKIARSRRLYRHWSVCFSQLEKAERRAHREGK